VHTNSSLTLYNRVLVDRADVFYRTVIPAVLWENRKAANVLASGGNLAADQATIFIPYSTAGYVAPVAWRALVSKTGTWTLQPDDIVVKGTVTDTLSALFTVSDLEAAYDDVLTLTSIDTMDLGRAALSHWQIGAK